ncbi:thiazolylpeptide-type bacteriocin [Actinomadura rudentiformis]|uniref:Thiazolylpeptide-type bacteriocin n=1 Tax=Actinomadura rudentiformis TaxID=359158 RepID=A0A6H9YEX3_9ACTN|nr:thiazolylpeptide-type bacteriocin [Actinomadura rudentiformis]KAB2339985.1 thiazolylpeptide-type bacteriocin [Actinomadura rudentiformis]
MRQEKQDHTLSVLKDELGLLEAETFEIRDHNDVVEELAGTTSCTSTTSSCTSSSGTSCCD